MANPHPPTERSSSSSSFSSQFHIRPRSRSRSQHHHLRPSISGSFTDSTPLPPAFDGATGVSAAGPGGASANGNQVALSSSFPSPSPSSFQPSAPSSVTVDTAAFPFPNHPSNQNNSAQTPSRPTPSSLFSFAKSSKSPRQTATAMSLHASQPLPPLPPQSGAGSHSSQPPPARLSNGSQLGAGRGGQNVSPPPPLPRTGSVPAMDAGSHSHSFNPINQLVQPSTTPHGGAPVQQMSILNTRGQREASMYQKCQLVIRRLLRVPGFEEILRQEIQNINEISDPVTPLWRILRRGHPLIKLYNTLRPVSPIEISKKLAEQKLSKQACYLFIEACLKELKIPREECFIITDLFQDDTTGFVKVINVIIFVLDKLIEEGVIAADEATERAENSGKLTHRQHIVNELVTTESTYVAHLDLLQKFKRMVEQRGLVSGDSIHHIFSNLNSLLDFQRRFQIRVEQLNSEPEEEQNWGQLFLQYQNAFSVYIPYIVNQKRCEEVAMKEFDKLKETGGSPELKQMTESPTVLTSFLLKPFQRLSKYPLLLRELRNKGGLSDQKRDDISKGMEAIETILQTINENVDKEERDEAVADLRDRVDDWRGLQIETFGELLLHGNFTVLKGDISSRDNEREYRMYLFETILLCCKEEKVQRPKTKIMGKQPREVRSKLHLKGRIFMQNLTQTMPSTRYGIYTCQIYWRGDSVLENFLIKFPSEDIMKKWVSRIEDQRMIFQEGRTSTASGKNGLATHFSSMGGMNSNGEGSFILKDTSDGDMSVFHEHGINRVESIASMRSRSTTGDSQQHGITAGGKFPFNVSVSTGTAGGTNSTMASQYMRMASQFSPTTDSPLSNRTSGSSVLHSQNHQYWSGNGYPSSVDARLSNDHARYAGQQRPSLNASFPHGSSNQSTMSRVRSASSPDIHNTAGQPIRVPDGTNDIPDMPQFPSHLQPGASSFRSQSNSPAVANVENPACNVDPPGPPPQAIPGALNHDQNMCRYWPMMDITVTFSEQNYLVVVPPDIPFAQLRERIFAKIKQVMPNQFSNPEAITVRYMVEGDMITIFNNLDLQYAIQFFCEQIDDEMNAMHPYTRPVLHVF